MTQNAKRKSDRKRESLLGWSGRLRCPLCGHGSVDTQVHELIRVSGCQPIRQTGICRSAQRVLKNLVNLVPLCGQLSGICGFILRLFFGILGKFKPNQC
jgi:hypothetical protein